MRTLPMMGTRFQAMGDVQRAALYATRPETVGRCGCVEGNRWRQMLGARRSWGRGWRRRVGSRSWRTLRAVPGQHYMVLRFSILPVILVFRTLAQLGLVRVLWPVIAGSNPPYARRIEIGPRQGSSPHRGLKDGRIRRQRSRERFPDGYGLDLGLDWTGAGEPTK
jgi:hypothetical protein